MKYKDLFFNDIDRDVNPAVSITDDNAKTIATEISEYVFTDDIINNLYDLLVTVKDLKKLNGKGDWVNIHAHVGH